MRYFEDITTQEAGEERYKTLAKKLHPDTGGTAQEFQAMKNEWEELRIFFKHQKRLGNTFAPPQPPKKPSVQAKPKPESKPKPKVAKAATAKKVVKPQKTKPHTQPPPITAEKAERIARATVTGFHAFMQGLELLEEFFEGFDEDLGENID